METAAPRNAWLRVLLVILSLGGGIAGQYWLRIAPMPMWSGVAWAAAVGFAVVLFFVGRDAAELPSLHAREFSATHERLGLVALLAIGAFFVCFRIAEIPAGLNHDAAWEGLYAIRILNGEPFTAYTPEAWGRETLTFYFRAAAIWLMGPTYRAIQAPGLLAGVLILPFFYWWARLMFGVRLAWMATLFLAASGWHLVFSRTGWRSDFQPFFMAVTCCFFVRGMQSAKPLDFFASGLALALTLNIYNGSRVFPAVFGLWLVLVVLQSWRWRAFVRRYGVGLVFMAIAFAIAIAPLTWFALHDWETFQGRAAALRGASTLGDALRASLLLFNYRGNGDDFFVEEPGLEFPTAVLWVFGVVWCLLRLRDERAQFLLIALLINLVPGMVSKPNLNRNVGTMVFVYAFVGLGAMFFAQQLRGALGGAGRWVSGAFLLAAATSSMAATYQQYLGPERRPIWGYYPETTVVGEYIKTIVPEFSIWVGGANFPRDSITYLSYQGSGEPRPNYVWLDDVRVLRNQQPTPRPGKGLAFVLANEGHGVAVLAELAQRYPGHRIAELRYPPEGGRVFAKALLVPASDAPAAAEVAIPAAPAVSVANVGEFQQPRGIGIARDGSAVIADFGHHRVQVLDGDGKFLRQWGDLGEGTGQFKEPTGVAVTADAGIAIADTWNGRVQMFGADGRFLGQSTERLYGPRGVAFAPDGSLVVADTGNSRLVRLAADGKLLGTWSGLGKEEGKVTGPIGVAVDRQGAVYVADNGNGRLQIFAADGGFEAGFAVPGWRDAVYSEPYVAVDDDGRIWLTVPLEHEVRAYDRSGKLLRSLKPIDTAPPFETPLGIAIDSERKQIVFTDIVGRVHRLPLGG